MNRNQIVLIVVPFLLIFGYQNCQKSNFETTGNSVVPPSETVSTQDLQKISLAQESLQSIQFKVAEVSKVVHGSTYYSVVKNILYSFDLNSGDLHVIDQSSGSDQKYCLSESLKSQLNLLLSSSSICKTQMKINEGQVCAQVIKESYANIITNRDEFQLGSASDSCGSNAVDLCEGSDPLKNWFKSIQENLPGLVCGS